MEHCRGEAGEQDPAEGIVLSRKEQPRQTEQRPPIRNQDERQNQTVDQVMNARMRPVPFKERPSALHDQMDLLPAQWLERPARIVSPGQFEFLAMNLHIVPRVPADSFEAKGLKRK